MAKQLSNGKILLDNIAFKIEQVHRAHINDDGNTVFVCSRPNTIGSETITVKGEKAFHQYIDLSEKGEILTSDTFNHRLDRVMKFIEDLKK